MSTFTGAHGDWLTVARLPAYAPGLNRVEGAWAHRNSSLGNLGSGSTPRQLAVIMNNRLKCIQDRPGLIGGFLAQAGLTVEPGLVDPDTAFQARERSELNAARISVANSSGSSQAAKWPPLSTSLK